MSHLPDITSDEDIKTLVHTFYDKVQRNHRLGYIFNDYAQVDWDYHLPRMIDFWSNLIFDTGRYKGRPFRQHLPLPIQKNDFDIWYGLFEDTVDSLFEGHNAAAAKTFAKNIAASFSYRFELDGRFEKE